MPKENLKVCLSCSVGGHLKQLLKLAPAWERYDHYFVMMHKPIIDSFASKENVFFLIDPKRNPFFFIINVIQSVYLFLRKRPDVVISTGAGVAIATCYIAKLFRRRVIYIEDWCVVEKPSFTGRLLYPVADLFIIQRMRLKKFYPKAVYGGELF